MELHPVEKPYDQFRFYRDSIYNGERKIIEFKI